MAFQKLEFDRLPEPDMLKRSRSFLMNISKRRTVREFDSKEVPIELISNAIKSASSAPSGANKQPWHFVVVNDSAVKKEIRIAAEKEEKARPNQHQEEKTETTEPVPLFHNRRG